jgi:regulator of sigma E protease
MLITLISFIVVFTVVTLAHELGHLYFSRRAGIRVLEFGIGFGPKLFSFVRDKTQYTLNLIPMLGYVRIAGLDDEIVKPEDRVPPAESFTHKSPGQRFMSIFGGPLCNMILAFIIFYFMFTVTGVPGDISNEIAAIAPASEASRIGMVPGDKIIAISGKKFDKMADAIKVIHTSGGKPIVITIERKGELLKMKATPKLNKKLNISLVGFSLKPIYVRANPFKALYDSFVQVGIMSAMILTTLGMLIVGKVSLLDLAGPVGIAQFTGQVAGEGIGPLLSFTAFLSINLGLLNLLPLPALDGGRLAFIVLEKIRGKAVSQEFESKVHQVGFILLLGLMAIVTCNDILRLFRK